MIFIVTQQTDICFRTWAQETTWPGNSEYGEGSKDPVLLHQFLAGLPDAIGEVKTLEAAMARARLLMATDLQPVAMLEDISSEVQLLTEQVALLTEQVAALSTRQQK